MSRVDSNSPRPLVSVVTACYNAAPYVAETIESVLAQSYAPIEHIIVGDASTDGSWKLVSRFLERHPDRVRAQRLPANRGGSHARNIGTELARGEYVMFLDADDRIDPDTIGSLLEGV